MVTFLHFVADLPMHNADMALYPHSATKMGFGLWGSLGVWSWLIEVIFTIILLAYAWKKHKNRGENIWMQVILICLMFLMMSPWFSPMKNVATLPEPAAHLKHGISVSLGFIIPSLILTFMYKISKKSKKIKFSN